MHYKLTMWQKQAYLEGSRIPRAESANLADYSKGSRHLYSFYLAHVPLSHSAMADQEGVYKKPL